MHVPTDVPKQIQAGSAAMAMLQEKVGHVFWLPELQNVIANQHHFRNDYRHEPWICTGIWFWDYKLRTTGSQFHETATFHVSGVVNGHYCWKWKAMPCCELVRDSARVNVWCGLMHNRVTLLLGTDCEQHLIPTRAETVCTSQLPPETFEDHLITSLS